MCLHNIRWSHRDLLVNAKFDISEAVDSIKTFLGGKFHVN